MINKEKPPNIVLIMADQMAPQFTSTYGHPIVKTPHLDDLAARGTRFDNAYCNSPLCAPSRFSFMAGQHVTNIAAYDNASEFPSSIMTFAHYLRIMGYRTCLSGKMHFVGPDQLHGFEERLTTDIYPSDFCWTPNWERPDERIDRWYHNMDSVFEAGCASSTFQLEFDAEVAFCTRRKIVEYAKEDSGPFCLVASFIHPHDPYVARPEWWDLYQGVDIDLPEHVPDIEDQDPHSRRLMTAIEADRYFPSDDVIRNARRGYYANMSYFDSQIGMVTRTLRETNQFENTIIIVTADHGEMLGERGLWYKMSLFEHSARVPMLMAGPGIANASVSSICSLVDLLPTMLDIGASTGLEKPEMVQEFDGRSLMPLATGQHEDGGEAICEYCAEMTSSPIFMLRRGAYKYIHCDDDPPLLYNIDVDPNETVNFADCPEHAAIAAKFADEVARRWDSDQLTRDIIAKQQHRHALHDALGRGKITSWDYNPPRDASTEYVRSHMDWNVAGQRTRVPAIEPPSGN